tara:strand:+ start:374 stop:526 length:153 start_codon:yes stop_codon:yes gene_type:complete
MLLLDNSELREQIELLTEQLEGVGGGALNTSNVSTGSKSSDTVDELKIIF